MKKTTIAPRFANEGPRNGSLRFQIPNDSVAHRPIDATDLMILELLQQDARLDVKRIAALVHRSASPVHERIRKLEKAGYIKRYTALLNREKIGVPLLAVAQVRLSSHNSAIAAEFEEMVMGMQPVLLCLQMSGTCDFMLHIAAPDTRAYQRFLQDSLCAHPFVEHVETFFVLKECKGEVL